MIVLISKICAGKKKRPVMFISFRDDKKFQKYTENLDPRLNVIIIYLTNIFWRLCFLFNENAVIVKQICSTNAHCSLEWGQMK